MSEFNPILMRTYLSILRPRKNLEEGGITLLQENDIEDIVLGKNESSTLNRDKTRERYLENELNKELNRY